MENKEFIGFCEANPIVFNALCATLRGAP